MARQFDNTKRMENLSYAIKYYRNKKGYSQEVLAEEINEHIPGCLTGRMSNNLLVHFPGDPSRIGKLFPVRLEECRGFYYMGKAVSQDDCG